MDVRVVKARTRQPAVQVDNVCGKSGHGHHASLLLSTALTQRTERLLGTASKTQLSLNADTILDQIERVAART
jgi:hypothetical protein